MGRGQDFIISRDIDTVVPHAIRRWVGIVVPVIDSPRDPKTVADWACWVGVSRGALRGWCRTAGLQAGRSLSLARMLRVVVRYPNEASRTSSITLTSGVSTTFCGSAAPMDRPATCRSVRGSFSFDSDGSQTRSRCASSTPPCGLVTPRSTRDQPRSRVVGSSEREHPYSRSTLCAAIAGKQRCGGDPLGEPTGLPLRCWRGGNAERSTTRDYDLPWSGRAPVRSRSRRLAGIDPAVGGAAAEARRRVGP